jgi:hypothetical protein
MFLLGHVYLFSTLTYPLLSVSALSFVLGPVLNSFSRAAQHHVQFFYYFVPSQVL